jgi:glutaredoxin
VRIILFWKENCAKCPEAKKLLSQLKIEEYESFDVDTEDGLTEASYYNVLSTPSILILDNDDEEIAGWRGIVPSIVEILDALK